MTAYQSTQRIAIDRRVSLRLGAKRLLLGTRLGRAAFATRDLYRLWLSPKVEFGTVINDQIAARLAVGLCPPDGTFVDVGAHIGSVMSEVLYCHPTARVIGFEAIPEKAAALSKKFPAAEVHCFALAEDDGEVSFFVDLRESGCSSLEAKGAFEREIRVETRRLDAVLGTDQVDVVKIDVEGAELGVLLGGTALLDRCRPIVMFESGPGDKLGYTKEAIFTFFAERGYGLYAPNRLAHTGSGMTLDAFLDSHEYPRRTTNYFALPTEREAAIREKARTLRA